ncbi:MAG: nucleoid-associated protein [Chitinophagales bacterium]|nr:nucleoid-associated protein [Chitinophagales bacterium]
MINYLKSVLQGLVTHSFVNQADSSDIVLATTMTDISDHELYDTLTTYFLSHFKDPEFFSFTHASGDIAYNPVYNYVKEIFETPEELYALSVKIARHLYEKSKHPNIKAGELHIAYFTDILIDDEMVDAITIIKSESKETFLHIDDQMTLKSENGINIGKLDKGCIIFNTREESGYKICNIDHSNRFNEAKYWREEFLMLASISNDYTQTKEYIQATKAFVKERLPKAFDTDNIDEAAMMQRSFEYFKNNESFDNHEYEIKVFKDEHVIEAFQDYKSEYENLKQTTLGEQFDISDYAVKKQSRIFKSVIKLDKNFHIYVHGDKDKIGKGEDESGRKYYILYYDTES